MRFSLSRCAARAAACVLAAGAGQAFAQTEPALEPSSSQQRLSQFLERSEAASQQLAAIEQEESTNGPYSVALIDQLQSLALLYQEIGRIDLAVESMQKALQVERANSGLYSLDQVPLIEQLVAAERARGNFEAVVDLEQRLLRLAHYHPNDIRTVDLHRDAGDRQLALYGSYLVNGAPELTLNLGFAGPPRAAPPNRPSRSSVFRAQRHYSDAIQVLLRTGSYADAALQELEKKLVYSYYLELTETDPNPFRVEQISALGSQAYQRLVAYQGLKNGSVEDIARALVELADWDLLFSRNASALRRYHEVYEMLASDDAYHALLAELFTPDTPIVLPAFAPNPLATANPGSDGYVDVEFEISRYGKSRGVKIADTSGTAAVREAKNLYRLISRSRFRPILREGEMSSASSVAVRYRF